MDQGVGSVLHVVGSLFSQAYTLYSLKKLLNRIYTHNERCNTLQKVPCLNRRSLDPFLSPGRPGAAVTACSLRPSADTSRDTARSPLAPQSHPCSPVPPQEQQGIGSGDHQTAPMGTQGIATSQHGTACIIWGKRGGPMQGITPAAQPALCPSQDQPCPHRRAAELQRKQLVFSNMNPNSFAISSDC